MVRRLDRILDDPASADDSLLDGLDEAERRDLAHGLKARIDELARSDPPSALPYAEILERAAGKDPALRAIVFRGTATAHHSNGNTQRALDAYSSALSVYEERGEDLEIARVLRSLVDVCQMAGRVEDSLRHAERARSILERLGEERLLAQLETNVGNVYVRLDDYPRARRSYLSACERLERIRRPLDLAIARYNLAIVESQSGLFEEAERTFLSARSVFESEGMGVHVADCTHMLSLVNARRGRFAAAIAGLESAGREYSIHRNPRGVPACDLDLAEVYLRLDARREARDHAAKAVSGFRALELDYELAKAQTVHGVACARIGDEALAVESLIGAREIFRRTGNHAWVAIADIHRCEVEGSRADPGATTDILQNAVTVLDDKGLTLWRDLARVALARERLRSGDHAGADELLGKLLSQRTERTLDALVTFQALCALADLRLETEGAESSVALLREAVDVVEGVMGELPDADIRIAFFRRPHQAYVDLAYLLSERSPFSWSESLELLESGRFRSASFLDEVREASGLRTARERLSWLVGSRLDAQLGSPGAGALEPSRACDAELDAAETELVRLRARAPGTRLSSDELRASVPEGELVVSYAVSRYGAFAHVVGPARLEAVRLQLDMKEIASRRRRWHFQRGKLRLGETYSKRHATRMARATADILDAFGAEFLRPIEHLLDTPAVSIVPYGALHGLPFHAFTFGGRPLGSAVEVSYGLSFAHLVRSRARAFDGDSVLVCGSFEPGLPEVREELVDLASIWGGRMQEVEPTDLHAFLGARRTAGGVLHLASHGVFHPDNPILSAILLGPSMLTAREIASMKQEFDLVVLSGCDTGRAHVSGGEEAFGIAQSFIRAGTRSVLCSLWPVRDADARRIMVDFHASLSGGATARRALFEAQELARERDPASSTWSAFALLGDPAARVPR